VTRQPTSDIHSFTTGVVQQDALGERVAQALRRAIILRELAPGLRITEPALAERFGVSRLPVRDALAQLEHEGLVRTEPRRGAFVVGFSEADLTGLYECRRLLESHAVRRLAEGNGAAVCTQLRAVADDMQAEMAAGSTARVAACDLRFHRLLVALSGNRMLLTAWEPLTGLIATIVSITDLLITDLRSAVGSHHTLIEALEAHDVENALSLMDAHLRDGERLMHEALKELHGGPRDDGQSAISTV
jgi:DNA-binding GntR family transcriptional regulator